MVTQATLIEDTLSVSLVLEKETTKTVKTNHFIVILLHDPELQI